MTVAELRARARPAENGWHRWPEFANSAVTLEEAELLHALVRVTQPSLVLELGTGMGVSARFIGEALAEIGDGRLLTVEPLEGCRNHAREALADLSHVEVVGYDPELLHGRVYLGALAAAGAEPELVFIDSGPEHRGSDIAYWLARGEEALLVVHDAFRGYPELAGAHGVLVPTAAGMWVGHA